MSAGQEMWIVASGSSKNDDKAGLLKALQAHSVVNPRSSRGASPNAPILFNVPDGDGALTFGSFDNLIRLTDDLQKADAQVDSVVHRLERQYLDMDPHADFTISILSQKKTFKEYLNGWQWDETRYPKSRSVNDNLSFIMSTVMKLDEEARSKMAQFSDARMQKTNFSKKDGLNLPARDLIDVITPQVVSMASSPSAEDDFIQTEYLATVPVILPRGAKDEFLKSYETVAEGARVVPGSAKPLAVPEDKEGNALWRIVVFKKDAEIFQKACRERKWVARDFVYSEEAYTKLEKQRLAADEAVEQLSEKVRCVCQLAWSDCMISWMHIKAMRVFVEGVLRFGMPPRFASYIVVPTGAQPRVRKALAGILGQGGPGGALSADKMADAAAEEGEEYFPYVSFSFTPFAVANVTK